MSTKIYDGYFVKIKSLNGLNSFVTRLRLKMRLELEKEFYKMVANQTVALIDKAALNLLKSDQTVKGQKVGDKFFPVNLAYLITSSAHNEIYKTKQRNPEFDFGFEVQFAPTEGGFLAIIYTERAKFCKVWEKMTEVSEFGYWNNSDSYPKGVKNRAQWEKRGKIWNKAIPSGIAGLSGFSVDCVCNQLPSPYGEREKFIKRVFHQIPSFEDRVVCYAKKITSSNLEKYFAEKDGKIIDCSNFFHYLSEVNQYLKTDEGKHLLQEEESKIKTIIPKITLELLNKEITLSLKSAKING